MTKEELIDIKKYIERNGKLDSNFNNHSKMYSMTTENIKGFLSNYNLNGKNVLTVAGSGDQRLNAYLMGASKVTCFDINPLSKLQLELKDSALKLVNFEKFIKFFGLYTKRYGDFYTSLDKRVFDEIKKSISPETYDFFNYVINGDHFVKFYDIYYNFYNNLDLLKNMNEYLNPDNYFALKNIIKEKELDFIQADLKNLPNILNGKKYDYILLSNISDYIHMMYKDNYMYHYRELIDSLTDNLNLYGTIEVGYIYSSYYKNSNISDFYKSYDRCKYFPTDKFHTVVVDSYDGNNEKDKIITYQKF